MFDQLKKYKNNGHFFFESGQDLSKVCNAPEEPGVYYVIMLRKGRVELVYIRAAGVVNQNGECISPLLRGSFSEKQDGLALQEFFEEVIEQQEIDALDIYWFVTFDKKHHHMPSYVEASLLQTHFDTYGRLPLWNLEC